MEIITLYVPLFPLPSHQTMDASKALEHVAMRLGQRYEFFKPTASGEKALCDARILSRLMKAITSSYQESNPYHNCLHATDVLLTSNAYLEHSGVLLLRKSTGAKARPFDWRLSRFALMLAAAGAQHKSCHFIRLIDCLIFLPSLYFTIRS